MSQPRQQRIDSETKGGGRLVGGTGRPAAERAGAERALDIVVKGRRADVSERYRSHVREKLSRLGRLDPKAFRLDVEICHEANPRLAGQCDRIELTWYSRGPVVRAEAAASDAYAALDLAAGKLEERLRRAADRRRARHHGQLHGTGVPSPKGGLDVPVPASSNGTAADVPPQPDIAPDGAAPEASALQDGVVRAEGPLVVRQKTHEAPPMTLDEALHHMEMVGHDFYLYCDAESGLPSVVYRRRGYAYGVLQLKTSDVAEAADPGTL